MGLLICDDELQVLKEFLPEASFLEVVFAEQRQHGLVEDILEMFKL